MYVPTTLRNTSPGPAGLIVRPDESDAIRNARTVTRKKIAVWGRSILALKGAE
jgi:hypothetical protein